MRARREERRPCGPRVAITRHGQSKAWHAGAGIWTSLGMGERVVLVRSSILSPTSKRSDRFAKHATNSMARCVPVSLRSHGLRATFLLRFRLRSSHAMVVWRTRPVRPAHKQQRPPRRVAVMCCSFLTSQETSAQSRDPGPMNSILKFFQVDITGMFRMTSGARYFKAGVGSSRPNWRWIMCFVERPKTNTSWKAVVKRLSLS